MTYKAKITCWNCGSKETMEVKLGVPVKDHLRRVSEKCSNCKFRL